MFIIKYAPYTNRQKLPSSGLYICRDALRRLCQHGVLATCAQYDARSNEAAQRNNTGDNRNDAEDHEEWVTGSVRQYSNTCCNWSYRASAFTKIVTRHVLTP